MDLVVCFLLLVLTVATAVIFLRIHSVPKFPQVPCWWIFGHVPDFWGKDFEKAMIRQWRALDSYDLFMQKKLNGLFLVYLQCLILFLTAVVIC